MGPWYRTFVSLSVLHLVGALSLLNEQRQHKRQLTTTECEREFYLDENLGENGRCQPCSEICSVDGFGVGREDDCERYKDQCPESYQAVYSTTLPPTTTPPMQSDSTVILVVTIIAVAVAVVTTTVLVIYLCRRFCNPCRNGLMFRKKDGGVQPASLHQSTDVMYITEVTQDNLDPAQMALLTTHAMPQNSISQQMIHSREASGAGSFSMLISNNYLSQNGEVV